MILELMLSAILWTNIDTRHGAILTVSCDRVTLDHGGKPTANYRKVKFFFKDLKYDITWHYNIGMPVLPNGKIELVPTYFWIAEIQEKKNITLQVNGIEYSFDLTGSNKLIDCI